jgi:hypothetical protein
MQVASLYSYLLRALLHLAGAEKMKDSLHLVPYTGRFGGHYKQYSCIGLPPEYRQADCVRTCNCYPAAWLAVNTSLWAISVKGDSKIACCYLFQHYRLACYYVSNYFLRILCHE